MNKIAITGDVHGSQTWKKIKINEFEKVILLGDYCDSYGDKTRDEEISNLKEIIDWKKANPDKVILLLGNHDINQYLLNEHCSRKAPEPYFSQIEKLFLDNLNIFQVAVEYNNHIISHAGFTKTWMGLHKIENLEQVNKKLQEKEFHIFRFNGWDCYGGNVTQGPTWIRPEALLSDAAYKNQIIGHTQARKAPAVIEYEGSKLIILECPKHDCIYELKI